MDAIQKMELFAAALTVLGEEQLMRGDYRLNEKQKVELAVSKLEVVNVSHWCVKEDSEHSYQVLRETVARAQKIVDDVKPFLA